MASPMRVPLAVDFGVGPKDILKIEIDGQLQVDRVLPWPPGFRERFGFGGTDFSMGIGMPFGYTAFDAGGFGLGAMIVQVDTLSRFPSGDYEVQAYSVDPAGNQSAAGEARTIQHRVQPSAPKKLGVADEMLFWSWNPYDPPG